MALTTSQKDKIIAKLKEVSSGGCPICQSRQWTIGEEIVTSTTVSLGGTTAIGGGPIIPMAQIICNNCGFVAHHAIGALGINLKDQ